MVRCATVRSRTIFLISKKTFKQMHFTRLIYIFLLLSGVSLQTVAQNPSCKVYKRDGDSFYFGKVYIPQGTGKLKLKHTISNDAYVVLYYGQLDRSKIYMKRMAVTEDCYYVDASDCSHTFVVRTNIPDDVEFIPATAADDEIVAENNSYYFNKALSVQNSFKYTEEEISNSTLQQSSSFKKRNIYVMADPATEGMAFQWLDQFGTTSNLPSNSLYMTGSKTTQAPDIVLLWPDDDFELETAVKTVESVDVNNRMAKVSDAVYNLQGQIVTNMVKGRIYIRNGRKFIGR